MIPRALSVHDQITQFSSYRKEWMRRERGHNWYFSSNPLMETKEWLSLNMGIFRPLYFPIQISLDYIIFSLSFHSNCNVHYLLRLCLSKLLMCSSNRMSVLCLSHLVDKTPIFIIQSLIKLSPTHIIFCSHQTIITILAMHFNYLFICLLFSCFVFLCVFLAMPTACVISRYQTHATEVTWAVAVAMPNPLPAEP